MLLDTCALLWLAEGGHQLSESVRDRIRECPIVHVSAITGFEICLKHHSGKLALPVPPSDWISSIIRHHDLEVISLNMSICVEAVNLPPIHKDPCDRFIIATAKLHNLTVVTADQRFRQYGVEVVS